MSCEGLEHLILHNFFQRCGGPIISRPIRTSGDSERTFLKICHLEPAEVALGELITRGGPYYQWSIIATKVHNTF